MDIKKNGHGAGHGMGDSKPTDYDKLGESGHYGLLIKAGEASGALPNLAARAA